MDVVLLRTVFDRCRYVRHEHSGVLVILADHSEQVEGTVDALTLLTVLPQHALQVALDLPLVPRIAQIATLRNERLLHLLVQVGVIALRQPGRRE